MDNIYVDFAFFFVGLGFFLVIITIVLRDDDKKYERRLNETREFGYRFDPDPPPKFRLFK